ncbi:hypothetical protein Tco_0724415 [Tanacetum coccineum]
MAALPICDELRISVNTPDWEPQFILRCHREISKDLRLAREINALRDRLTAVVDEREAFADELDMLAGKYVAGKMAEFTKQVQNKDIPNLMKLQILGREFEPRAQEKEFFIEKLKVEDGMKRGLLVGFSFVVLPASFILIDCATVVGLVGGVVISAIDISELPLYVCSGMLLVFSSVVLMSKTSSRVRSVVFAKWIDGVLESLCSLFALVNSVGRRYMKKGLGEYLLEVFNLYFSSLALCSVGISKRDKITHCSDATYVICKKLVSHPTKAETQGVTSWVSSQHNGVNNREN